MSLSILYTNSDEALAEQNDPDKSLGGFISISPVPNDVARNLFGALSLFGQAKKFRETKIIALKNETGSILSGASLYYENASTSPFFDIEMAVVIPALDECERLFFEKIPNMRALPLNATFINNLNLIGAISLPDIEDKGYVGIWIKKVLKSFVSDPNDVDYPFSCEKLNTDFQAGTAPEHEELLSIKIDY